MARAVWAMADEIAPSAVPLTGVADCTLLSELMYCLATNVSCETVEAYVGAFGTPGQPASKYVNVYTGGNSVQSGTNFILRALGYALAVDRNVTNGGECAFTNVCCGKTGKQPHPSSQPLPTPSCTPLP